MATRISVIALLVATIAVAIFFFKILQPFLLPLVFACVLAVLSWPIYQHAVKWCRGHRRIAALFTTAAVMLLILVPLGIAFGAAAMQLLEVAREMQEESGLVENVQDFLSEEPQGNVSAEVAELRSHFTSSQLERMRSMVSDAISTSAETISQNTLGFMSNVVNAVIGVVILGLSLYYFLADNDAILSEVWRLSPLDRVDDRELTQTFVDVCRGVLLGNVLAAFLQAILNGLGFFVVGVEAVLLLSMLTFVLSMIPFLGAASVWIPVALWLAFEGRYLEGILLAAYGAVIVSSVDNLIRAYALSSSSPIHPLMALLSILGAAHLVGLWGLIIGPVSAAFLYALLNLLNKKAAPDGMGDRVAEPHRRLAKMFGDHET